MLVRNIKKHRLLAREQHNIFILTRTTSVTMATEVTNPPRPGSKLGNKVQEEPKKLPRPIVFWSLNEKTAYRRNRVVQTRMNMIMDDIATQRESSRKSIRYEAHKFRQKNSKYYNHPMGANAETQASAVNIAPPNWKPPNERTVTEIAEYSSDENGGEDGGEFSPRQRGIITRAKKPSVTFSMYKEVHQIEDDLKIDDLENTQTEQSGCTFSKRNREQNGRHVRSSSAVQYREKPGAQTAGLKRQQSALPAVRTDTEQSAGVTTEDSNLKHNAFTDHYAEYARNAQRPHTVHTTQPRRSESYFDKSKAAYQLRQDLRKRAKMRKQGVKMSVFTLQDAINLEKEKFHQNKDKIIDYIKKLETLKKTESDIVNKWTKDEVVNQLSI